MSNLLIGETEMFDMRQNTTISHFGARYEIYIFGDRNIDCAPGAEKLKLAFRIYKQKQLSRIKTLFSVVHMGDRTSIYYLMVCL